MFVLLGVVQANVALTLCESMKLCERHLMRSDDS
jgi:hypothetical protein